MSPKSHSRPSPELITSEGVTFTVQQFRKKKMKDLVNNFDTEVLERSHEVPVLVDFWSPSCGPCLFLGPVLEKLEGQDEGKWEMMKVNTMHHGQLAADYGVSSIPHVQLFYKGKKVSEFVGALPEGTLVKWLAEFLPTKIKEKLSVIRERLTSGDRDTAVAKLREFVVEHPEEQMGKLILAHETVLTDPLAAREMVSEIKLGDLLYEGAENVRILAELMGFEQESETPAGNEILAACAAIRVEDFETAIASMIKAVEIDKKLSKELPRRGAIALFRMFGPNHPLSMRYRRKFEMALY
jgi:putative thioredoxin